jgi:hypothetical protein
MEIRGARMEPNFVELKHRKSQMEPGNSGVCLRRVWVDFRNTHLELKQRDCEVPSAATIVLRLTAIKAARAQLKGSVEAGRKAR